MTAKIRVGVSLDTVNVPAWQFAALESIAKSEFATISHVFVRGSAQPTPEAAGLRGYPASWLHRIINRLQSGKDRPEPDACVEVSASPLIGSLGQTEDPMDALVVFGDPRQSTTGLPRAPLGHWYFTCSGRPFEPSNGILVGLAELIRRRDTLDTSLVIHETPGGRRSIAYSTRSAINYGSHYATRNEHLWKCSSIVIRALKACHTIGARDYLSTLPTWTEQGRNAERKLVLLSAFVTFAIWRACKKVYRRLFAERWVLMSAIDEGEVGKGPFAVIAPPRRPFLGGSTRRRA